MVKITKVSVKNNYRLELTFDNGVCGVVDLSDLVGKGVFAVWRDPHIFQQVQIGSFGELTWLGKIDLCPDSLYLKLTGKKWYDNNIRKLFKNKATPLCESGGNEPWGKQGRLITSGSIPKSGIELIYLSGSSVPRLIISI